MPVVGNHDKEKCYDDRGEIRFRPYFAALAAHVLSLSASRAELRGAEFRAVSHYPAPSRRNFSVAVEHGTRDRRSSVSIGRCSPAASATGRTCICSACGPTAPYKGSDATLVLTGHNHYYERSKPLDGITYVVSGGGARTYAAEKIAANHTAAFTAGRNHYGLVDVYADHLEVRVLDLDDHVIDEFAVALCTTEHAPGTAKNLTATELPPIEALPAYREERLGFRPGAPAVLPRPW